MVKFRIVFFVLAFALGFGRFITSANAESMARDSKIASTTCSKEEIANGTSHISKQLNAFRLNNIQKAYTYASKDFKSSKNLKQFEELIKTGYPMLIGSKNFQIVSCDKISQLFMFVLNLSDKSQQLWEMRYLISYRGGAWGVEAATITQASNTKINS